MEIYVDYNFYTENYKGTTIPENSFNTLAKEASRYIYKITQKRAILDDADIKMATCEVAETIYKHNKEDDTKVISSETLGPRSISYKTKSIKTDEEKEKEKYRSAKVWLADSPENYLFRGISRC